MKSKHLMTGILLLVLFCSGCVERIIAISTEPAGALVWLNGEEIGATPCSVSFTWYGDYDITIRKEGYQTIRDHRETPRPLYQYPGLDFFSEILLPVEFVDRHEWHYDLAPPPLYDTDALAERARSLKKESLNFK